uniref:Unplaced genomic scaffold supercont1.26, whole genome shotgun sequence n=1 Tax=Cryptococcus bacillisporus CA1280 TaxID=1296109 RepID=A0A0D0TDX5_CRYGA|nr:membrane transporter [Cryptococcus bacillisporus CA1280]
MSDSKHFDDEKNIGGAAVDVSVLPAISDDAHHVQLQDVDEAAAFVAGWEGEITEEMNARIRRKCDWHLLPLMMTLYFVQFTDKTTLGSSAILGIKTDTHLSQAQYNWLGTIFYLSYLIFEWPQAVALQKFPPGKWMACNILVWAVCLCCHAACKNFGGLFVCRFFLGVCEGSITAGFLILTSMFYTQEEATQRVGYWFLMNGTAQIFNGVASFGVYHVNPDIIAPWKVYMLITGLLTLAVGLCFWFFIPNNPMTAYFLTKEERIIAIERLRGNSTGIENKTWKKEQFIEALTDWKCWAFAIYAGSNNVANSLTNMTSLIINSFGFTVWQTTLLGIVSGAIEILTIWSSVLVIKKFPNARGYVGASYSIPNIVSGILLVALPWAAKGALLLPSIWAVWVHLVSYFLCHGVQLPTLGTRRRLLQTRCFLSDTVSVIFFLRRCGKPNTLLGIIFPGVLSLVLTFSILSFFSESGFSSTARTSVETSSLRRESWYKRSLWMSTEKRLILPFWI